MKRWLFNLAAGVSLALLLLGTAGLWFLTCRREYIIDEPPLIQLIGRLDVAGYSGAGRLEVVFVLFPPYQQRFMVAIPENQGWIATFWPRPGFRGPAPQQQAFIFPRARLWGGFRFGLDKLQVPTGSVRSCTIDIPYWFLSLIEAILLTAVVRRILRTRRRYGEGCCQICGYDLRATPDRCPECGTECNRRGTEAAEK